MGRGPVKTKQVRGGSGQGQETGRGSVGASRASAGTPCLASA